MTVVKLIYNLSFEPKWREKFDNRGYVPRLIKLLKEPPFRGIILKVLYQLSMDDRTKSKFTYTECIPLVYQIIINFPEPIVGKEVVALAINLVVNPRNAEIISEGEQLTFLIDRTIKHRDPMLFKVVRNIATASKMADI
mmetsp:Transcript_21079/g.9665  ORF Transcript_21079/g.9665 Transcript_21079/m.9665 type:complete len:139 (-) Transcript_21079:96-512(-)